MAKISSYPSDNNVSLSDRLIGTDAENNDATKNFIVGDLLNLIPIDDYVPYIGATGDVNLGTYNLYAFYIEASDEIYSPAVGGDIVDVYNELRLGAATPLFLDGNEGSVGDILVSQGPGNTPTWESAGSFVPYTGATQDVNLGGYNLSANALYEGGSKLTSYVQAFSAVNQQQTNVGVAKIIEFETGSFSDTASIISNVINFNAIGKYKIEITARVEHTSGGGDAVLNFWLQYSTGGPIPFTRQTFTIANAHTQEITYNFMLSIGNPADSIRAYWSTSNLAARFQSVLPGGIFPFAPSVMINVYKIG